jgi:hypothetical protein
MWLNTEYEAVTLFSLRLSSATASGGKTLLAPTPYAIKMALLDVASRTLGVSQAEDYWLYLRDLKVALRATEQAVISNVFQKVLKPRRNAIVLTEPDAGTFQRTIGYREYVQLVGRLGIALGWAESDERTWLDDLLLNVNYFGKRGSFMQLVKPPERTPDLPADYVDVTSDQLVFAIGGTLQVLDDCTSELTFEKANIYSDKKVKMGKERITRNVVLPYRLTRSSKSFSLYERF